MLQSVAVTFLLAISIRDGLGIGVMIAFSLAIIITVRYRFRVRVRVRVRVRELWRDSLLTSGSIWWCNIYHGHLLRVRVKVMYQAVPDPGTPPREPT